MYIIVRESFETNKEEVLLKDGSWTSEDSGKFMHFIDWTDAMYHLIFMERDHNKYDYRVKEIGIAITL